MLFLLAAAAIQTHASCDPGDAITRAEPIISLDIQRVGAGPRQVGALEFAGGLLLWSRNAEFREWSGLEVTDDGRMLAVSDEGYWLTAELTMTDGRLRQVCDTRLAPIRLASGAPSGAESNDAEGLANAGDGEYLVSFEDWHRISAFSLGDNWANVQTASERRVQGFDSSDTPSNSGAEALAIIEDRVWVGFESASNGRHQLSAYSYDRSSNTGARLVHERNLSLVIGSDYRLRSLTPDREGGLYLLATNYIRDDAQFPCPVPSRSLYRCTEVFIGRLPASALGNAAAPIEPEPVAFLDRTMWTDNFESLDIATFGQDLFLFLLSDDNSRGSIGGCAAVPNNDVPPSYVHGDRNCQLNLLLSFRILAGEEAD